MQNRQVWVDARSTSTTKTTSPGHLNNAQAHWPQQLPPIVIEPLSIYLIINHSICTNCEALLAIPVKSTYQLVPLTMLVEIQVKVPSITGRLDLAPRLQSLLWGFELEPEVFVKGHHRLPSIVNSEFQMILEICIVSIDGIDDLGVDVVL